MTDHRSRLAHDLNGRTRRDDLPLQEPRYWAAPLSDGPATRPAGSIIDTAGWRDPELEPMPEWPTPGRVEKTIIIVSATIAVICFAAAAWLAHAMPLTECRL